MTGFESFSDKINDDSFLRIPHKILHFFNMDVEMASIFSELMNTYKMQESRGRLLGDRFFTSYEILSKKYNLTLSRVRSIMQEFIQLDLISYKQVGIGNQSKRMYLIHWDKANDLFYGSDNSRGCTTSKNDKGNTIDNSQKTYEGIKTPSYAPIGTSKLVRRSPREQPLFPSKDCEDIFTHWNNLGYPLAKHKLDRNSSMFKQSVAAIQGALKKYDGNVIKRTMTAYHALLISPDSTLNLRGAGHKVPLCEFFKFSPYTEELILKSKHSFNISSWFEECLKGHDHLVETFGKFVKDDNPKVTESIKQSFQAKISGRKLSVSDINCFIRSSRFIVEYHTSNVNKINWNSCLPEKTHPAMFARRLIDAVIDDAQDVTMIEPSWLCSPRTQNSRFPKYLRKHGLIETAAPTLKPVVKKGYDPGYKPGEID